MKSIFFYALLMSFCGILFPLASQPMAHTILPASNADGLSMSGPVLYGITAQGKVYKIDMMTCEFCLIASLNGLGGEPFDILVLPNGDLLTSSIQGIQRYTLPNTNPVWTSPTVTAGGSIIGTNGVVYLTSITPNGLSTFDPATNTVTYIGDWPPATIIGEFFYQNGILYGAGQNAWGVPMIYQIDITNPGLSFLVQTISFSGNGAFTNEGYTSVGPGADVINLYNVTTNTFDLVCDFNGGIGVQITGLSDIPPGIPEAPCLCTSYAGTGGTGLVNACTNAVVTVPHNNNEQLEPNDVINFIMFSNPADTLGSIVAQSGSAVFSFNPATMQTGVTYYLASIAGNNSNGLVDLNDPCLDISNTASRVIWQPAPTVNLSLVGGNPNLCAGQCADIQATFTGTAPYYLFYTAYGTAFSQTFSSNPAVFQVCIPAGTPTGPVEVEVTTLLDGWFCNACN